MLGASEGQAALRAKCNNVGIQVSSVQESESDVIPGSRDHDHEAGREIADREEQGRTFILVKRHCGCIVVGKTQKRVTGNIF